MAFINCPKCGTLISDRAVYCPKCGVFMENHLPHSEHAINSYCIPIKIVDKEKECQTEKDKQENEASQKNTIEQMPYEANDSIDVPQEESQQNDDAPTEKPTEKEKHCEAIPVKEAPAVEEQLRDSTPVVAPSKSKKKGVIIGGIVGALLIVGLGLFFLLGDIKETPSETVPSDINSRPVWIVAWEGKLFDNKSVYPIEMHLTINNNELDSDAVSGYYFYKKKGSSNKIPLIGEVEHAQSRMSTYYLNLYLHSEDKTEDFCLSFSSPLNENNSLLEGSWVLYDQNQNEKRTLEVDLNLLDFREEKAETSVSGKDSKQSSAVLIEDSVASVSRKDDSNIPDWLCEKEWDDMDPLGYDVESAIVFSFRPDNTFAFKECTWDFDDDMRYSEKESHGTYSIDGDLISIVFSDGRSRSMTIDYDYHTLGYNGKVLRSSASSFSIDYIPRGAVFFPEYSDKAEKFCRVITDSDNNNIGLDIRFYPGLGVSDYFNGSVDIDAPQKSIKLFHKGKNELYDSDGVYRAKVVVDSYGDFELVGDGQLWYLGYYLTEH